MLNNTFNYVPKSLPIAEVNMSSDASFGAKGCEAKIKASVGGAGTTTGPLGLMEYYAEGPSITTAAKANILKGKSTTAHQWAHSQRYKLRGEAFLPPGNSTGRCSNFDLQSPISLRRTNTWVKPRGPARLLGHWRLTTYLAKLWIRKLLVTRLDFPNLNHENK